MAGEVTRHLYAARLKEARAEPLLGRSLRCLVDRHLFSDRDSSVQPKVLQQQADPKALTRLRRTGQGRVRELWASLGRHFDSGMGESPVMESELYRDGPETFAKRSCFEQVSDSVPPWGGGAVSTASQFPAPQTALNLQGLAWGSDATLR